MKKYVALLAAVCLAFSVSACGSSTTSSSASGSGSASASASASTSTEGDGKTFTVGFDAEYPPYGYMDDNGEYTGFDLELAQAVCDIEGWSL